MAIYPVYLKPEDTELTILEPYSEFYDFYYGIYLQSDHWKMKRIELLEYCDYRCICGIKALQAHHTQVGYFHLWREDITKLHLLPVCRGCHAILNNKIRPGMERQDIANDKIPDINLDRLISLL